MKVAVFNFSSSGLFHYTASLVNALIDTPGVHSVTFFTSSYNNLSLIRQHQSLQLITAPIQHTPLSMIHWSASPRLRRIVGQAFSQARPDVVHINDTLPLYLPLYNILRAFPVLYTQHDPHPHTGDRFSLMTTWLQAYLRHLSSAIVVHGHTLKRDLVRHHSLKHSEVLVIPLGDLSILLKGKGDNHRTIPKSILFFGRIAPYKGLGTLCAALLELQQAGEQFHLTLAGPGNLAPYRKQLHQIRNVTVINTFIPDADVHRYFEQHRFTVLPYLEATQSAVIALALPAGLPVIASRVGALPEVIQEGINGMLVPPGDVPALRGAIRRLLHDSALHGRLREGALRTAHQYAWHTIAPQYLAAYQKIK